MLASVLGGASAKVLKQKCTGRTQIAARSCGDWHGESEERMGRNDLRVQ